MANKRVKRTSKVPLNIFEGGGLADGYSTVLPQNFASLPSPSQVELAPMNITPSKGGGSFNVGGVDNVLSGVSGVASSIMNGLNTTANAPKISSSIAEQNNVTFSGNSNDSLLNEWSSYSDMGKVTHRDVSGKAPGSGLMNTLQGATAGASAGGVIGAAVGAIGAGIASIFGNRKAKRKAKELNRQIDEANQRARFTFANKASGVDTQNDLNMQASFAAFGGQLPIDGPIAYDFTNQNLLNSQLNTMDKSRIYSMPNSFMKTEDTVFAKGGGIHIKPSKRGTFTAAARKHGKGVQEFARQVLANKEDYSPAMVKKANFARNASKWNHKAMGGSLFDSSQHGGEFSNGVTMIGNGGTHEENPNFGVPQGIGPNGQPNLVEEGEVKFNNYIFSNRIHADGDVLKDTNLKPNYKNNTYAKIAERLSKESSERPNDPISKRGLMSSMSRLQQAQELQKENEQPIKKEGNTFDGGGPIAKGVELRMPKLEIKVPKTLEGNTTTVYPQREEFGLDWLRYAPVIGSGIGVVTDLLGKTNKPDYSSANMITDARRDVDFDPVGNYLAYKPLDRNYYTNMLNAQSAATRRAVANTSGGNRATALAGQLAADYNAGMQLGNLARQAEEYNLQQRQAVEQFNRATNMFNSEGQLKADTANNEMAVKAAIAAAQLREQADQRASAARSANLANFFDSLSDVGREEFSRNMINSTPSLYYKANRRGRTSYKNKQNKKK